MKIVLFAMATVHEKKSNDVSYDIVNLIKFHIKGVVRWCDGAG